MADEGLHGRVVQMRRAAGYDVTWVKEVASGTADADILAWPDIAEYVLLTNDRDFSDLIFNHRRPQPLAVLYSRLPHRLAADTFQRFVALLEGGIAPGQMTTITKSGERAKPFPSGVANV